MSISVGKLSLCLTSHWYRAIITKLWFNFLRFAQRSAERIAFCSGTNFEALVSLLAETLKDVVSIFKE